MVDLLKRKLLISVLLLASLLFIWLILSFLAPRFSFRSSPTMTKKEVVLRSESPKQIFKLAPKIENRQIATDKTEQVHITGLASSSNLSKQQPTVLQLEGTTSSLPDRVADLKNNFKLIYTGQQNHIWSATIQYKGRLYDVVKGTELPSGDKIVDIDQDVVILQNGQWKKVLSFYGAPRSYQIAEDKTPMMNTQKIPTSLQTLEKMPTDENSNIHVVPLANNLLSPQQAAIVENMRITSQSQWKKKISAQLNAKATVVKAELVPVRQYSAMEQALLKSNAAHFTILLRTDKSLAQLETFAKQQGLSGSTKIYRSKDPHGEVVYSLLYKEFTSSEEALIALSELPIECQRWTPELKSIAAIQNELAA